MVVLIILGAFLQLVGLIGCVLPWLAGPPLNFVGLILLSIAKDWKSFSPTFLVVMGGLTVLTMVLDYAMPLAGARRFGASKRGWGGHRDARRRVRLSAPWLILGFSRRRRARPGKKKERSGRLGVFVGMMAAAAVKLIVSGLMMLYFIRALL
jgi:uncharacterized protein YqgC (DUF456 family)